MNQTTVTKKPISMYPREWAIVESVNQEYGLNNTSAAVRLVCNEYARLRELAEGKTAVEPQEESQ
jgi:hypothetical protein